MKNRTKVILFSFTMILIGLTMLLYPWVSNYLYDHRTDSIVAGYDESVRDMDDWNREQELKQAKHYNKWLNNSKVVLTDPFSPDIQTQEGDHLNYNSILSFDQFGLMGSIEIPKINVYLPIYHGTGADVLERGVGHLENSSLPVGGAGTHAVLSAHTGLNSAKLFTDLVNLEKEDLFFLHILGDTLAYKVCEIRVVEPENTSSLNIRPKRDLVTLITCTPYGINSHRLLVTGERTEYVPPEEVAKEYPDAPDSMWMKTYFKAVCIGLALVFILFFSALGIHRVLERRKLIKEGSDGE